MNENKTILVTGASSGVGRATAQLLSKKHGVIVHGRDMERLLETKEQCAHSSQTIIWRHDLSDIDGIEESFNSQALSNGGVNIFGFVHCAGIINMNPLRAVSISSIAETMNVNYVSAVILTKILMSKKYNADSLRNIVYISSNISGFGAKAFSSYAASKGALDSFMKCMAVELAPKVRINSILPGGMRTRMTEETFNDQDLVERMESQYPLGMGIPENIADAVEFLLSDKASWITGQQITIDGGRTVNITG